MSAPPRARAAMAASAPRISAFRSSGRCAKGWCATTMRVRPSLLVFNRVGLILDAAAAGHGLAFVMEHQAAEMIARGMLVRVLEDWCTPFDGYYLYYPNRRQPSAPFSLLLEAL